MLIGGHRITSIVSRLSLNTVSARVRMNSAAVDVVAVPSEVAVSSTGQAKRAVTPDAHQLTKRPRLDEDDKPSS